MGEGAAETAGGLAVIGCRGEIGWTVHGAFARFWRMMSNHSSDWCRLGRVLLVGLATIAGPFWLCAEPGYVLHPAERKPSIIFILADDLGSGDLGCYG